MKTIYNLLLIGAQKAMRAINTSIDHLKNYQEIKNQKAVLKDYDALYEREFPEINIRNINDYIDNSIDPFDSLTGLV